MNQFVRRSFSLFLALTLVAGMLPMGVFATETTEPPQETEVAETVETAAPAETAQAAEETTLPEADTTPAEEETEEETTSPAEETEPEGDMEVFSLDDDEMSEEDFVKAVQAAADKGNTYELSKNVTLTEATAGLLVENFVHVQHGYTLTLAEGASVRVQNEGQLVAEGGTIDVQNGASLVIAQDSFLQVWRNGTLNIASDASFSANPGLIVVNVQENATVNGVSESMFTAVYHPQTSADIEAGYKTYGNPYARVAIYLWDNVTLTQDITIPNNCSLTIQSISGHTLMVSGDCTLTNYGNIFLEANSDNRIVVEKDATFTNYGWVTINTPATFSILGTYNNYGTVGGTGSISTIAPAYVTAQSVQWNEQDGGWVQATSTELSQNIASNFTAWQDHYLVFYLNTYDVSAQRWVQTPVIPDGFDSTYISLETLDSLGEQIGENQTNGAYFVRLRTKGTLDYYKTTLFCGDVSWDVELWPRAVGLYSGPIVSTDTALYSTYYLSPDQEEVTLYLSPLNSRYILKNVSITGENWDNTYDGATFTQGAADEGYAISISPEFLAHCRESWDKLWLHATCTVYDSQGESNLSWYLNLEVMPDPNASDVPESHAPYVTARWLDWGDEGQFENTDVELSQDTASNITAGDKGIYIFYLNTWDEETGDYKAEPIIPTSTSEYITITKLTDTDQQIKADEVNKDYFVVVETHNTLTYVKTSLSYGDLTWDYQIHDCWVGFFTTPEPSADTIVNEGNFYLDTAREENAFYWIALNGCSFDSFSYDLNTWGQDYSDATGGKDLVTVTRLSETVYKFTINADYVDYVHCDWRNFNLAVHSVVRNGEEYTQYHDRDVWINPGEMYEPAARIDIWTEEDQSCCYNIFNGSDLIFLDHRIGYEENGNEIWAREKTTLPAGVSYDVETNTLILNNADLYGVNIYSNEEDVRLPEHKLNIRLLGNSTMEKLRIGDKAQVTITEDSTGTLTCNDWIEAWEEARLTFPDYQILLSESCEVNASDGAISGEFGYVDGARFMSLYWLDYDEEGNLFFNPENGGGRVSQNGIQAFESTNYVFFLNTWSQSEQIWNRTPIIPGTTSPYLTITPSSELGEDIQDGQKYADWFFRITVSGTLGDVQAYLTYDDLVEPFWIGGMEVGYYSAPQVTTESALPNQHETVLDTKNNIFYFIVSETDYYNRDSVAVTWELNTDGQDLSFLSDKLVETTFLGDGIYKITVDDAYADYVCHYWCRSSIELLAHVSYTDANGDLHIYDYNLWLNPPAEVIHYKAMVSVNTNNYYFYEDGKLFTNARINGVRIWHETDALPEGVSYDYDTNTVTLTDANLECIAFHYEDTIDGELQHLLPNANVTLRLVGENSIENDYGSSIYVGHNANLTITGDGSVSMRVTNTFPYHDEEDGWYETWHTVMLASGSDLTFAGNVTVDLLNRHSGTLRDWLNCIHGEENNVLTVKDNALLNLALPTGYTYHDDENAEVRDGGYVTIGGISQIKLMGNAQLITDRLEVIGNTYTQTGGTLTVYASPSSWFDENSGAYSRGLSGIFTTNATLSISGGKVEILTPKTYTVAPYEDYPFYAIEITGNTTMNVSGGEINVHNGARRGFGIAVYTDGQDLGGTLNVTGGILNLLNEKQDGMFFNAMTVSMNPELCQFRMTGGTINADGRMFPTTFYMEDGTINLTGCDDSQLPSCLEVFTGYIRGGKINIQNATFVNDVNFSIDGGEIAITNTVDGMTGLENNCYLPVNGGTITIETQDATAVVNYGTFHQMGGTVAVTAKGGKMPGMVSLGALLLNSGTMEVSGRIGIVQSYDPNNEYGPDKAECYFQTGGGTGDHKLTIRASAIGILADGVVQLTGNSRVTIYVTNTAEDGVACGICAEKYTGNPEGTGENLTGVVIEGAAQVKITVTDVNGEGMGLYAIRSPLTVRRTQLQGDVAPTLTIRADMAIRDVYEDAPGIVFDGVAPYTDSGADLTDSWSTDTTEEGYSRRTLRDGNVPASDITIRQTVTTLTSDYAEFIIMPYCYRVSEQNGQQIVEVKKHGKDDDSYVVGALPEGVAYDLATNTMTLSNQDPIGYLWVKYLTKEWGEPERATLPSRDFTLHLANENVEIYMMGLEGQVNATVTGSGTLRLMDSTRIEGNLTISEGVTLINDLAIVVWGEKGDESAVAGPAKLTIARGAGLVNNAKLLIEGDVDAFLDVQGTFTQGENGQTVVDWKQRENVTGNISKDLLTLYCVSNTETELAGFLEESDLSQYRRIDIYAYDLTLEENHTIPKNTTLTPETRGAERGTLTIAESATLTISGIVNLQSERGKQKQLQNNGNIRIAQDGCLYVDGNFYGNAPINEGGRIMPQATKLTIEKPEKTTFDLYEEDSVCLKITVTGSSETVPLQRVTWTSSNKDIVDPQDIQDNQDGTYTVKFTGKAMGKVTLTATTIDGAKKTAKVTLTTTCLSSQKLTATLSDTAVSDGLQLGESIQMTVFAGETQLAPQLVRFTSSNESIATVDENGIITGISKTGTVKITAKLNIDGDSRSVTKSIKVIAAQKETVSLYTYDADNDLYEPISAWSADLRDVTDGLVSKTITLYAMTTARNFADGGQTEPVLVTDSASLKWVSSDTSLATVKANKDGSATVTIKSKAYGLTTITATATDKAKASTAMTLTVMDYTPRLGNAKITLNPMLSAGTALELVESYGNQILDLTFADESLEGKLELVQEPETRAWTVYAGENCPAKGTLRANLRVYTQKSRDVDDLFEIPLTVTIKSSIPSVTVKQEGKLNLTYRYQDTATDTYLEDPYLKLTVKDAQIDRIVQNEGNNDITTRVSFAYYYEDGSEPGYYRYDSEKQPGRSYEWAVCYLELFEDCSAKVNTKLSLDVYLEGYNEPVTVTHTVKTTTGKLKVTIDPTTSTLNTKLSQGEDGYTLALKILENGEPLPYISEDNIQITADKTEVTQVKIPDYGDGECVYVILQDAVACTLTITLKDSNWVQPQTLTHKVKVSTTNPTTVFGTSTLTLYRTFFDIPVSTTASTSQSNIPLTDMTFSGKTEGILLSYSDGTVTAKFADETPVKAGKYTFTATGYVENAAGEKVALKSTTLTVTVTDKDPTIPMENTTVKLNKKLAGNEYGEFASGNTYYALNVVGNKEFAVAGLVNEDKGISMLERGAWETSWEDTANGIRLTFCRAMNCFGVKASLLRADAKKTTYTLYPVASRYDYSTKEYRTYTLTTPIKLTVQPYSGDVTVNMTSSGKLDLLLPDSSITYLATIKNALEDKNIDSYVEAIPVRLRNLTLLDEKGNPYDMEDIQKLPFLVSHYRMIDDSRTPYQMVDAITLKLNPDYAPGYTANKTYKVKFGYTVCGQVMESKVLSIKVNQSTAKVSASAVTYYQAEGETVKPVTVTLTSPAKATIGSVTVNSKTSQELRNALGEMDYSSDSVLKLDGNQATLYLPIAEPDALKAGKTYYLYLDVTPNSLATAKPTTLKISFKVAK